MVEIAYRICIFPLGLGPLAAQEALDLLAQRGNELAKLSLLVLDRYRHDDAKRLVLQFSRSAHLSRHAMYLMYRIWKHKQPDRAAAMCSQAASQLHPFAVHRQACEAAQLRGDHTAALLQWRKNVHLFKHPKSAWEIALLYQEGLGGLTRSDPISHAWRWLACEWGYKWNTGMYDGKIIIEKPSEELLQLVLSVPSTPRLLLPLPLPFFLFNIFLKIFFIHFFSYHALLNIRRLIVW